jgi:hypothetical protein
MKSRFLPCKFKNRKGDNTFFHSIQLLNVGYNAIKNGNYLLNSLLFTQNDNYKEFIALTEGDYNVTSRNCWCFWIYW